MLYRVAAAAACIVLLAGCQQAGPGTNSPGVTAPSSVAMKAVDVPFSGEVTGEVGFGANPQNCPAQFTAIANSQGTALHMGQMTFHSEHCVDVMTGVIDGRVLILTAANGDEIHGTYTGQAAALGPVGQPVRIMATFVFDHGTGRFTNATGTAQMTGEVINMGMTALYWPAHWEWTGTIRY